MRLSVLLLLAAISAVLYLDIRGFPPFLKDFVTGQIRRAGIASQFRTIRLDLFRGVIATDAVLADARRPDRPLARIDEVQLEWNWRGLWHRKNVLSGLRIANATLSIPTPPDEKGASEFTASGAYAMLAFGEDGTITIDQLTGLYCGIRLQVSGRVKPQAEREAPEKAARPAGPLTFVTKILRELNSLQIKDPPQLYVRFDVDLAEPMAAQLSVQLRGHDLGYRNLRLDSAAVDVDMHEGAIRVSRGECKLYGGEVDFKGVYDLAKGEFDLELATEVNPSAVENQLPPKVAKALRGLQIQKAPRLQARYRLAPDSGTSPVLSVDVADVTVRGVSFRSIHAEARMQFPDVTLTNVVVVMAEGRLTGYGQFNIESSDFIYALDSTLDVRKLCPLMFDAPQRIVEPCWFGESPHIVAKVHGDFVDPDAFGYDAEITARTCSYRGVLFKSVSAKLHLEESKLDVRDLDIEREDGRVWGTLLANFNAERVHFNVHTTANPWDLVPLLGPRPGEFMLPYRFGPHTAATATGVVDFCESNLTSINAQITNEFFSTRGITVDHGIADLIFTNNILATRIDALSSGWQGIKADHVTGTLLFTTNLITAQLDTTGAQWQGLKADHVTGTLQFTNNQVIAQLDGTGMDWNTFKADAAHANFTYADRIISARFDSTGFKWWRLKSDRARATLVATNDAFELREFLADVAGGTLRGDAKITGTGTNNTYRLSLEVEDADINKLLTMMSTTGKPAKPTGELFGHLELWGTGSEKTSLTGKGDIDIHNGVLWEAPIFGIFSEILGKTKATKASASFAITNNVVFTKDLKIAAGAFDAESRGQLSFDGGMDFRVQARFLSAIPGWNIVAAILGKALEYKVGGTIGKPTYRAVNLPKELLPHDTN